MRPLNFLLLIAIIRLVEDFVKSKHLWAMLSSAHELAGAFCHKALGSFLIEGNFQQSIAAHRLDRYDHTFAKGFVNYAITNSEVRGRIFLYGRGYANGAFDSRGVASLHSLLSRKHRLWIIIDCDSA